MLLSPQQLSCLLIVEIRWKDRYTKWLGETECSVSWLFPSILSFSAKCLSTRFWNYGYGGLLHNTIRKCSFLLYFLSLYKSALFDRIHLWNHLESFDVIPLINIRQWSFVSPFSKLYFSRNLSISSKLPNWCYRLFIIISFLIIFLMSVESVMMFSLFI